MDCIDDLKEANRCIRELVALSLLPAMWAGGNEEQIRESLADGLQNSLRAQIAYVRGTGNSSKKESIRLGNLPTSPDLAKSLGDAVTATLAYGSLDLVPFRMDDKEFQLAVMPLGPAREFGVIAVGSNRASFPTPLERILLNVSVNQAIIAFRAVQQAAAMEEASEHRRLALEASALGAWDYRFDTDKIYWDERCRNMWGVAEGSKLDYDSVIQQIHPDYRAATEKAFKEALAGVNDGKYRMEFPVLLPNGAERWLASYGQAYFEKDGEGKRPIRFVGVSRDMTKERRASELLEQTVQERTAQLKETIAELESFSYSISHDMRSPLRAMQGYADALLDKYKSKLDETGAHYLDRIRRAATRMDLLIQDVLAYSKIANSEIQLKIVDLESVIHDVIENYPQFQAHKAGISMDSRIPKVVGHEAYLTQIVSNLLGNAVKFVSPGAQPKVRIWAQEQGANVRVWFEDNGIGIDPRHHEDIFQIFGRVYPEKKFEGTGIGLAIVRKATHRLGGAVGLTSELGKGSRFWITLKTTP